MLTEKQAVKAATTKRNQLEKVLKKVITRKVVDEENEWLYLIDVAAYLKIYDLIIKKRFQQASDLLFDLDTSPRDEFPDNLYEFLNMIMNEDSENCMV